MRVTRVMAAACLVMAPGSVFGQEWIGQPRVSTATWTSEYGAVLPARVYEAEAPSGRYSMTVVDYRDIERILTEKSKSCPAGAETCRGNPPIVAGHQLHLTNPDKSRTFASIYAHENRLYVMEGTVPDGYPEPGLFQQSLGWLDEKGNGIRYSQLYLHGAPPPPIASRGGRGGFGRIDAPGATEGR